MRFFVIIAMMIVMLHSTLETFHLRGDFTANTLRGDLRRVLDALHLTVLMPIHFILYFVPYELKKYLELLTPPTGFFATLLGASVWWSLFGFAAQVDQFLCEVFAHLRLALRRKGKKFTGIDGKEYRRDE